MQRKSTIGSKLASILFILCVSIALVFIYNIYKENYFGEFHKAEYTANLSQFKRDKAVKQGKKDSYRIVSTDFNDAMYYKKVSVTPYTPYRVSCMIKTENVVTQKEISNAGAGICIADTTECSSMITGTQDWQKVELLFNSKNRTEVEIGFRLGSYADNCKGMAWFSDLKLEVGSASQDTHWKMACFIFPTLDVTIEENGKKQQIQEKMTNTDVQDMKDNMERLKDSIKKLSNYQMTIDYDIIEMNEPIDSVTYDEENGYYVAPSDVASKIENYVKQGEYDYIYIAVKFGSILHEELEGGGDWVGLGGMDYQDIGFSNIRLPNDAKSYIYKYNTKINLFPEEAFLHEFLHTLERISRENGYEYPVLHDYEKYGYQVESRIGLRNWYRDFMTRQIETNGTYIGINEKIYSIKPVHSKAFEYSMELPLNDDPDNIIEEIRTIFGVIINSGSKYLKKGDSNT